MVIELCLNKQNMTSLQHVFPIGESLIALLPPRKNAFAQLVQQ